MSDSDDPNGVKFQQGFGFVLDLAVAASKVKPVKQKDAVSDMREAVSQFSELSEQVNRLLQDLYSVGQFSEERKEIKIGLARFANTLADLQVTLTSESGARLTRFPVTRTCQCEIYQTCSVCHPQTD